MKVFGVKLSGLGGTIKKELDDTALDCVKADDNKCTVVMYKDGTEELFDFVEFKHDW